MTHAPNVCQPETVAQEESFFNALRSAVAFELQDSTLILFNRQRQEVVSARHD
ncbi:MAG: META domain-containing protein [Anaerolineae bacterium]